MGVETPEGKYVYCLIRNQEPREFSTLGIGERGDVVHTVHHQDLAAVVSDSPVKDYFRTRRNMMAHTVVLEEVMKEFTLLPVRFGTIAPSEKAICKLVERRFDEFQALLNGMEGKVELGLKAMWYEKAIFQAIVDENPPIRRLRDSLMGRSPEETYYDRIRLGEMIETAMEQKKDEDAEEILGLLRPLVYETRMGTLLSDQMILNTAFLLDEERQAEFDQAVEKLDREMGHRTIFKYVGPVPPYNFVTIMVTWET